MKRITIALALFGAGIALMGQPKICQGSLCPTGRCLNSSICLSCVCASPDGISQGVCVQLNAIPDGYRLLP